MGQTIIGVIKSNKRVIKKVLVFGGTTVGLAIVGALVKSKISTGEDNSKEETNSEIVEEPSDESSEE